MISFDIHFHSPFRISSGLAAPGVDAAVDPQQPIPESSIKGVMRAGAVRLGVRRALIDAVFGTPSAPSPWAWQPVTFVSAPVTSRRARTPINPQTGTVRPGALLIAEEVWCDRAAFTIDQRLHLSADDVRTHRAVLVLAGRSVRSLGATRNRGLGWVSIAPNEPAEHDGDVDLMLSLLEAR
ncbi:MAG: hypothetical protein KDB16_08190 [Acidimicrobiales bacterium]|nr:hypothetical protein [Acidimicrobiales bacterium]